MPTATLTAEPESGSAHPHWIGRYRGNTAGPVVVCFGGLHGNEPLGVVALERALLKLASLRGEFHGQFLAIRGNPPALAKGCRYLSLDLNRVWTEERIRALRDSAWRQDEGEERAQAEILSIVDGIFNIQGEKYFIDLHTTSASSGPFAVFGDTLRNRRFALQFPVPVILGLEEQIDGALLEYATSRGAVTYGFEAGQHEALESADRHEAVIWLALVAAGCLAAEDVPGLERWRTLLARAAADIPPVMEVRYRHSIAPGDGFEMDPGFINFQKVRKGDLLAHDLRGEIRAKEDGRVLMPLYQQLGSDGFFLARDVRPFWLGVSQALRRLRMDVLLPWLPGVRVYPGKADTLLVNPRVAKLFPVEIFHLLGFRKLRQEGALIVMTKRAHDLPTGEGG